MAIKIEFDKAGNLICPTVVLMTKGGRVFGVVSKHGLRFKDCMEDASELSFSVDKGESTDMVWKNLVDFKLLFIPEWKTLFECQVSLEENAGEIIKNVTAKSLGASELSQVNVYGLEVNTENDIAREDYKRTVLYNAEDPSASLLDRLLEKAPHYKIHHVDTRIANVQRTFSFDGKSILDCLRDVCKEIQCHLELEAYFESGKIVRQISLYDLLPYCNDCHERGDFNGACGKCGSTNIEEGYGRDTTIFLSNDNLTDGIRYSGTPDSVKNCFHLEAGDDLMTAAVAACNPNGSSYIWKFSDACKEDMSDALIERLAAYDQEYSNVSENFQFWNDDTIFELASRYNAIVRKYKNVPGSAAEELDPSTRGFQQAIFAYYTSIDFGLFLSSAMYPSFEMEETNAGKEIAKLQSGMFVIGVKNLKTASATSIDNSVVSMVKTVIHFYYDVTIVESAYTDGVWRGKITVKNRSDEEDTATSGELQFTVNDDYVNFTKQKIEKVLANADNGKYDVASLFKSDINTFRTELNKYCLNGLEELHNICQGCIDVLIQRGASNQSDTPSSGLYESLYVPYYEKSAAIEEEIKVRESEVKTAADLSDGVLQKISAAQKALNLNSFLGDELFCELASFRRDDSYQNSNYISDGLDNAEIIQNASDFFETAQKEIEKASRSQHQIEATLRNLFAIKEFEKIRACFSVGNWMRIMVDSRVYKLRLIDYELDFEKAENTQVSFSDATDWNSAVNDVEKILSSASSMATSYGAVTRQAKTGSSAKDRLDSIQKSGINVSDFTIVAEGRDGESQEWGENGLIARSYNKEDGKYDDRQLKLLSNGIFLTSDSWKTVRSAIGEFRYRDPVTGNEEVLYGINAELLAGNLILGENLLIKNSSGTMSFDGGLRVTNGVNTFIVNPNSDKLMQLLSGENNLMYVDDKGRLFLTADGTDVDIASNDQVKYLVGLISGNTEDISSNAERITSCEAAINKNKDDISANTASISNIAQGVASLQSDYSTFKTGTDTRLTTAEEDILAIKEKLGMTDETEGG